MKSKLHTYCGERWRGFKTQLTSDYIKDGDDKEKTPYEVYSFIDPDVQEKFVVSRTTPTVVTGF